MAYSIGVFSGQHKIGKLSQDQTSGLLSLVYNTWWQQNGFPLSPALTLHHHVDATRVYHFLDNLLPEGKARLLLAQDLGVSEKHVFPQICQLGADLPGAISFRPSSVNDNEQALLRPIAVDELVHRLDHKEAISLLHWDNKPRLSVAGVQDKLNVFVSKNGDIGLADGTLCSTHILKFERPDCPALVLNEYICMKLSAAVGLPTAEVAFKRFGQHPALLVSRFDRQFNEAHNKVFRRHVIDGCQALDLPRDYKYERNLGDGRDVKHIRDGASLEKLFAYCRDTSHPAENMQWLIHWQCFNLMINNHDSHGKNVSFYFGKHFSQFTPAYDLVNVSMFTQFKQVLAMAMGDEFAPDTINAYQLADFAQMCDIDKKLLSRLLLRLADKVLKTLTSLDFIADGFNGHDDDGHPLFNDNDRMYTQRLINNIKTRTTHLKSQASDIASIEL